jgi:hypothetical protein
VLHCPWFFGAQSAFSASTAGIPPHAHRTGDIAMIAQDTDTHEAVSFADLRALATAKGPCLTAVVPLPNPAQIEIQIKNAIRGLQKKLVERAVSRDTGSGLLAPIEELAAAKADGTWAHALILLSSPGLFRYYLMRGPFKELQTVEDRFQIRPLLATLAHEARFHLLALSQKNVRLFHCTQHRIEPAANSETIPRSLEAWMNSQQPDHMLASRSSAGPSVGRMKGVVSGTSTDREREDQYLAHFFKEVDKGVSAHLRNETGPLVLAGVEYELAIYRRLNSYRPALEGAISGSPDGLPDRTLHQRAMELIESTFTERLQKTITDVREHAGTPRSSTDPRTVVQAAFQGRVLDLLVADNAEYWGAWNEETQHVDTGNRREELLNAAALQTLQHNGRAFVLKESDMPVKSAVAAFFRF